MGATRRHIIELGERLSYDDKRLLRRFLNPYPEGSFIPAGPHDFAGQTIVLSHPLRRRDRDLGNAINQIKFDILGHKPLGQGANGYVFEVIKSLAFTPDDSLREFQDGKHVAKIAAELLDKNQQYFIEGADVDKERGIRSTPLESTENEMHFLKTVGRFHPKKITLHTVDEKTRLSFLTTRKFSSKSLKAILAENTLTTEQRFDLTIALLRALKEQVHNHGILHCDLKPDNIIVNLDPLQVNIIDYGLATKITAAKKRNPRGNHLHAAPEIFTPDTAKANTDINLVDFSEQSDIYGLGIVIARVWGNNMRNVSHLRNPNGKWKQPEDYIRNRSDAADNLIYCKNIMGEKLVKKTIASMVAYKATDRKTLSEHIQDFHSASLQHKYPSLQDGERIVLSSAFKDGAASREKILNRNKDGAASRKKILKPSLHELKNLLNASYRNLPDDADENYITEFIAGMGWQALKGATTKDELFEKSEVVFTSLQAATTKYKNLLRNAKEQLLSEDFPGDELLRTSLLEFIAEISWKLNRQKQLSNDIDRIQYFTNSLESKYEAHHTRLMSLTRHQARQAGLNFRKDLDKLVPIDQASKIFVDSLSNRLGELPPDNNHEDLKAFLYSIDMPLLEDSKTPLTDVQQNFATLATKTDNLIKKYQSLEERANQLQSTLPIDENRKFISNFITSMDSKINELETFKKNAPLDPIRLKQSLKIMKMDYKSLSDKFEGYNNYLETRPGWAAENPVEASILVAVGLLMLTTVVVGAIALSGGAAAAPIAALITALSANPLVLITAGIIAAFAVAALGAIVGTVIDIFTFSPTPEQAEGSNPQPASSESTSTYKQLFQSPLRQNAIANAPPIQPAAQKNQLNKTEKNTPHDKNVSSNPASKKYHDHNIKPKSKNSP